MVGMVTRMQDSELVWLSNNCEEVNKYSGKWIAILKGKILASGDTVMVVMEAVKKMQIPDLPLITKVPRKEEELYVL